MLLFDLHCLKLDHFQSEVECQYFVVCRLSTLPMTSRGVDLHCGMCTKIVVQYAKEAATKYGEPTQAVNAHLGSQKVSMKCSAGCFSANSGSVISSMMFVCRLRTFQLEAVAGRHKRPQEE